MILKTNIKNKIVDFLKVFRHSQSGMSLVEIIATVTIIILLLATGIPAFRNYQKQNELISDAENIKDMLTTAQNYALAPEFMKDALDNSYIFLINTDENQVNIYRGLCSKDGLQEALTDADLVKKFKISQDISMSLEDFPDSQNNKIVCYSILDQGKIIYPVIPPTEVKIILNHSKIGSFGSPKRIIGLNIASGFINISK